MSSDFARVAEVSSRELGARVRLLRVFNIDLWLVLPLLVLSVGGLFVLYSASGQSDVILNAQCATCGCNDGFVDDSPIQSGDIAWGIAYIFALATLMLVAVTLFGVGAKGAQRWLSLGFIRFQPSEMMKVAMPLALAWWLSKKALPPDLRSLAVAFAMVAPSGLIAQPDLERRYWLPAWLGRHLHGRDSMAVYFFNDALALVSIWPAWVFVLKDYQKQRVLTCSIPNLIGLALDGTSSSPKRRLDPAVGRVWVGCKAVRRS